MGQMWQRLRDHKKANELAQEACKIAQEGCQEGGIDFIGLEIQARRSLNEYEKSLSLALSIGDDFGVRIGFDNLAASLNPTEALALYERLENSASESSLAYLLTGKGAAQLGMGRQDEATATYLKCLEISSRLDMVPVQITCCRALCNIFMGRDEISEAQTFLEKLHTLLLSQGRAGLDDECTICMESRENRKLVVFACSHWTCTDCVTRLKDLSCPLCRR